MREKFRLHKRHYAKVIVAKIRKLHNSPPEDDKIKYKVATGVDHTCNPPSFPELTFPFTT